MNNPTVKFLIFALFSAAALSAGYLARKRNIIHEDRSRDIHLFTLIFLWAPVTLVSFWRLEFDRDLLILMLIQPLLMCFSWLVTAQLARLFRFSRHHTGVVILCSVLSNQGFTLGAYLCYTVFRPADLAMSYAIAFVTSMQVCMVLIFYPVAQHYAQQSRHDPNLPDPEKELASTPSLTNLILSSFLDIRAMPLYAAVAGIALHLSHIAIPSFVTDSPLLDVLFFCGSAGSYFGIGLRLRLGDSRRYIPHHILLFMVKFGVMPAFAVLCWWLMPHIGLTLAPLPASVLIVDSFAPTAINTVILANLFHLDARMASVLWLWNTALFVLIPLPFILLLAH